MYEGICPCNTETLIAQSRRDRAADNDDLTINGVFLVKRNYRKARRRYSRRARRLRLARGIYGGRSGKRGDLRVPADPARNVTGYVRNERAARNVRDNGKMEATLGETSTERRPFDVCAVAGTAYSRENLFRKSCPQKTTTFIVFVVVSYPDIAVGNTYIV